MSEWDIEIGDYNRKKREVRYVNTITSEAITYVVDDKTALISHGLNNISDMLRRIDDKLDDISKRD